MFIFQCGTFITAYARNKTIRTSQKIKEYSINKYGIDMYCYSDTDSIHTILPIEELKLFCEIDDVELGKWKHESSFQEASEPRGRTDRIPTYKLPVWKRQLRLQSRPE